MNSNLLLKELKEEELKITGNDEDSYLLRIIETGKKELESLTGTSLSFDKGQAKSLLFSFCRYKYNNAEEYFEDNFHKSILRLQLESAVKQSKDKDVRGHNTSSLNKLNDSGEGDILD